MVIPCLFSPHIQISYDVKSAVPVIIVAQIVIAVMQMQNVAVFDKLTAGADLAAIDFFEAPKDNFADTNNCSIVAKIGHDWNIDISMSEKIMG